MTAPIVLAFSGGLDTCWCIPHLRRQHNADIITVSVDCGGFDSAEQAEIEAASQRLGAVEHVFIDARRTFHDEVLAFLVMGNVLRGHLYPLCVGAERGLQAREVASVAIARGAQAIAHGCTAAGNDQVRFEIALRTLAPSLPVLAPVRDAAPTRPQQAADLADVGFDVPASTTTYSVNAGLWGTTIGGRETLTSHAPLPEDAWQRTRGAFAHPRPPASFEIDFTRGIISGFAGQHGDPVHLISKLDAVAASYGIGRGIHLGDTILGSKGRVAFEAPAATVLIQAHRELEKLVLSAEQMRTKDRVAGAYGDMVHEGRFLDPACRDIEALFRSSQARVTGRALVRMYPGGLFVEGVDAPASLLAASTTRYGEAAGDWSAEDARGFSRVAGLASILHARADQADLRGPVGPVSIDADGAPPHTPVPAQTTT
ncbi:MAG: argininosuccinate synthase [Phycisphaerales bacterium]